MSYRASLASKSGYYDQLKVVIDRVIPEMISDPTIAAAQEAMEEDAYMGPGVSHLEKAYRPLAELRAVKLDFHKAIVDVANRRVVELLTGQGPESMRNAGILGSENPIMNALDAVTKVNDGDMPLPAAYEVEGERWNPNDFKRKIVEEIEGFSEWEVQCIGVYHDASDESRTDYYDRLKELLKLKAVTPESISDEAWEEAKKAAEPTGMLTDRDLAASKHEQALFHAKLNFEKAIVNAANRRLIKRLTGQGWKHMEDAGILEGYDPPIVSALHDIKKLETGKSLLTGDKSESLKQWDFLARHRDKIIAGIDTFVEEEAQRLASKRAGARDRRTVGTGQYTSEEAVVSGSGIRLV